MKKIGMLIGIFLLFTALPAVSASASTSILTPVIESIDLMVDGSASVQHVNQTPDSFSYIMRMVWRLHWANNELDWDDFGNLAEGLVNGVTVSFDGEELIEPVKSVHDLAASAYELSLRTDDKNPKDNCLTARVSFYRFVPGGLDVRRNQNLTFTVSEDINDTFVDGFAVALEGYLEPVSADDEQSLVHDFGVIAQRVGAGIFSALPQIFIAVISIVAFIVVFKKFIK